MVVYSWPPILLVLLSVCFGCGLCCVWQAGEFLWRLALEATPGGPEHLPVLTAPLGSTARHTLVISNPTAADATFEATSRCDRKGRRNCAQYVTTCVRWLWLWSSMLVTQDALANSSALGPDAIFLRPCLW